MYFINYFILNYFIYYLLILMFYCLIYLVDIYVIVVIFYRLYLNYLLSYFNNKKLPCYTFLTLSV